MDSGIAGIADRRRRKSFVHASVVRVASILKLLVCQLAACGVEPVGNGAVHAQRHVLVDSVQDDPRHLTVIVRIACLGFGDGRDVHDTFAFASIWHAQCVQFVDACRDHFLEDVLGGLVLDAVGSGSSHPSNLPPASSGRMPAPPPSMTAWNSDTSLPDILAALAMTSDTRSPALTSAKPPALLWSDRILTTSAAFICVFNAYEPG